jgi:cell division protein FtsI/penicillin-binding protein 2
MILLLARLFTIQVLGSRRLSSAAVAQRAYGVQLEPARGQILDRNRVPLTDFRRLSAVVFPCLVRDKERASGIVSSVLGLNREAAEEAFSGPAPAKLREGVTADEAEALRSAGVEGVLIVEESRRYSRTSLARHVVGYTDASGRGVAGIERAFDDQLRGEAAKSLAVCVDAAGRPLTGVGYRLLGRGTPGGGLDVVLTIDCKVQAACERVLDETFEWDGPGACKGAAVVVLDARTGEILAMAARPQYDQDRVGDHIADPRAPLLNRCVRPYVPGSVLKVVTAAAAIEEGRVGVGERFVCPGWVQVGPTRLECSSAVAGGHGVLGFREALAHSCNVAFAEVGRRIGAETLIGYIRRFGFGRETGAVSSGESPGSVPDPLGATTGDVAGISIGQWKLTATPLQVAQAMTAVVNSGTMLPVTLVKEISTPGGRAVRVFPRPKPVRVVSPSTAAWVRRGLLDAVTYGSGRAAMVATVGSAGKTGSAETGRISGGGSVLHAWFAGYAPALAPKYICCVLVEEGGYGGAVAAPMFRSIMEEILR